MKSGSRISGAVLFSVLLVISLTACDIGNNDYSGPELLIGTWDLSEIHTIDDMGVVDPGTVILVLTDTTF